MSEIIFKEKPLWTLEEPIVLNPEETQTFSLPSSIKTAAKFLTLQQEVVRNGATEDDILSAMKNTIYKKPAEHQFHLAAKEGSEELKRMSQIGG